MMSEKSVGTCVIPILIHLQLNASVEAHPLPLCMEPFTRSSFRGRSRCAYRSAASHETRNMLLYTTHRFSRLSASARIAHSSALRKGIDGSFNECSSPDPRGSPLRLRLSHNPARRRMLISVTARFSATCKQYTSRFVPRAFRR